MEIRFIDEKHAADINIPNEPFPIRGRMVITYNGDRWEHTEKLLPSEQIEETTFPDENYNYHEMKDYVFIGAYEGADCIGLAILTPVFNPCLFLFRHEKALLSPGLLPHEKSGYLAIWFSSFSTPIIALSAEKSEDVAQRKMPCRHSSNVTPFPAKQAFTTKSPQRKR